MNLRSLVILMPCLIPSLGLAQDVPAWSWSASGHYVRAFEHGGAGFTLGIARRLKPHFRLGLPVSYSSVGMGQFSDHRQLMALGGELIYVQGESGRPGGFLALGASLVHSNVPLYSYLSSGPGPDQNISRDGTSLGLTIRSGFGLPVSRRLRTTITAGVTVHSLYDHSNSAIWTIGLGFASN
jgi:hypothetical protein